jgi:CBS domain-containing protein
MKVQRIMTENVATCSPESSLAAAAGLMWQHDCGIIPVVDGARKVIGIITDRDICMSVAMNHRLASEITVGEVISGQVFACSPDDDISQALGVMQRNRVLRVPVVDEAGRLQGILSMNDVVLRAEEGREKKGDGISYSEVVDTRKVISEHRNVNSEGQPFAQTSGAQTSGQASGQKAGQSSGHSSPGQGLRA